MKNFENKKSSFPERKRGFSKQWKDFIKNDAVDLFGSADDIIESRCLFSRLPRGRQSG